MINWKSLYITFKRSQDILTVDNTKTFSIKN